VHSNLADLLLQYKAETAPGAGNCDWLFPSPRCMSSSSFRLKCRCDDALDRTNAALVREILGVEFRMLHVRDESACDCRGKPTAKIEDPAIPDE